MKEIFFSAIVVWLSCQSARAQMLPGTGDLRAFELTPVAPPVPALKYELLVDRADQRPGNAALLYYQAESLSSKELWNDVDKATDAYEKGDGAKFDQLAKSLDRPSILTLLHLAARCDQNDRGTPIRELGSAALLPYLNDSRALATLLNIRAIYQLHNDQIPGAMSTIRDGLEFGRNIGSQHILVTALVGQGILTLMMSDPMTNLMNRPDSPNLYWALANLPRPLISLRDSLDAERMNPITNFPQLAKGDLDALSVDDWHAMFDKAVAIYADESNDRAASVKAVKNKQTVDDEVTRTLPLAAAYYSRTYNAPPDQVEKLDPFKVVATYWFSQYRICSDDSVKASALSYPVAMAKSDEFKNELERMRAEQPANAFLLMQGIYFRVPRTFARVDRIFAALTTVEALRSYAAAHGRALPGKLDDLTDTPAPLNPATGKPFDYQIRDGTATLSDSEQSTVGFPMKYTIRIRR